MEEIFEIAAVAVAGPMLGVEFGVAAFTNQILGSLPEEAYRRARSTGGRILGKVMPFWYAATVLALLVRAVLRPEPLLIAAVLMMVPVMVVTLAVLVPINNRVVAGVAGESAQFDDLAARWDRLHWVRVALLAVSFLLLVVAVVR